MKEKIQDLLDRVKYYNEKIDQPVQFLEELLAYIENEATYRYNDQDMDDHWDEGYSQAKKDVVYLIDTEPRDSTRAKIKEKIENLTGEQHKS